MFVLIDKCHYYLFQMVHLHQTMKKTDIMAYTTSRKHAYIILTPLNPILIQLKWGLQGYTLFFLFLLKRHRLWVLVRTASPKRF